MKKTVLIAIVFFLTLSTTQAQGKLEKAEKSVSKKEDHTTRNRSVRNRTTYTYNNNYDDDSYSSLGEAIAFLIVELGLYITYYTLIESPEELYHSGSKASITKYPYLNSNSGNYAYNWGDNTEVFRTTISNRFIAENSKLYGNHLNIDTKFLGRIGFELNYLQLWEENTNFGNNSLAIYTALAKYHRVRTERFNAWWGLGASYADGTIDQWGFTYGLGAEFFFTRPFSLEANFNQTLINDRTATKANALLNYHQNRYKFSGGYEYLKIGSQSFSTFSVGIGVSF